MGVPTGSGESIGDWVPLCDAAFEEFLYLVAVLSERPEPMTFGLVQALTTCQGSAVLVHPDDSRPEQA